jgi:hypothetical protein
MLRRSMPSNGFRVRLFEAPRNDGERYVLDQPRPTNGILLAITVMNSTLASSGSEAM